MTERRDSKKSCEELDALLKAAEQSKEDYLAQLAGFLADYDNSTKRGAVVLMDQDIMVFYRHMADLSGDDLEGFEALCGQWPRFAATIERVYRERAAAGLRRLGRDSLPHQVRTRSTRFLLQPWGLRPPI